MRLLPCIAELLTVAATKPVTAPHQARPRITISSAVARTWNILTILFVSRLSSWRRPEVDAAGLVLLLDSTTLDIQSATRISDPISVGDAR
jgi:hypothetical protein